MTRRRLAPWVEAVAALVTFAAAVLTVARAGPGELVDAVVLAVALTWGVAGVVADLLAGRHRGTEGDPAVRGATRSVTTIVRLGEVPDEIARTTVAVAAAAGPVVVLAGDREVIGLPAGVRVLDGATVGGRGPLERAVDLVDTHAVVLASARALPRVDACRRTAARLRDDVGFAIGTTRPLNADRFGSDRRDLVDARLRSRPGTPWLWEPDATVVRTDVLRDHPLPVGRPLGSWIRDRARDGVRGVRVGEVLALRAAPVSASGYWPDTVARQRAVAADLADAAWRGGTSARGRLQAGALLVRALSGWSLLWWLAALVLAGDGLPVSVPPVAYAALVGLVLVLRWLALRVATGVRPAPVRDALAALYAVPGSLGSTGAAVTRRVRPSRVPMPTRPLVWLALVATVVAAHGLLTADPGDGGTRVAAVLSVALLVLLWVFTVRSLVEKNWERTGFRVRLDLEAAVVRPGAPVLPGRVVDGSTGGLAFRSGSSGPGRGDEVEVRITLSDGSTVELAGTVAGHRRRGDGELLGIELRSTSGAWATELVAAARDPRPLDHATVAEERGSGRDRAATVVDRIVLGAVVLTSLLVVAALTLVLVGYRPLVVRSGSMEPTYRPGDLVLVDARRAGDLRPGEVATRFDSPDTADSLTHRVLEVRRDGDTVTVETRGDANDSSEVWTVPVSTEVGVVVARVPFVGRPATLLRTSTGWMVVGGVVLVVMVAVVLVPRRARRTDGQPAERVPTG